MPWTALFQPTPPARTETCKENSILLVIDISTHSAREDGDLGRIKVPQEIEIISTHSAREDGDNNVIKVCYIIDISTHSAREDGDASGDPNLVTYILFQPTPPARTETIVAYALPAILLFQPTPPARTETAILHKKTNNSSSHFHNQITSYSLKSPPTYPAHIQSRFHCAVFPVRIPP